MPRTKTVRSVVRRADKKKKKTAGSGDGGEPSASSSIVATIHKPAKCEKEPRVWIDAEGNILRDVC
jgi:hypothetical protein